MTDGVDEGADGADDGAAGGSELGTEARRLAEAVQQWARRTLPAPSGGHAGSECQWCPLCQFAGVLRGEHPELTARIVEAGGAMASAVRALVESAAQHGAASHPGRPPSTTADPEGPPASAGQTPERPEPAKAPEPPEPPEPPRVQRIRLTDQAVEPTADPARDRPAEA